MSNINDQVINETARMVRVAIPSEKMNQYRKHIESVLDYVDQLNKIDTSGTSPLLQVSGLENVFRDDIVTNKSMRDSLLTNAPSHDKGLIKVRAVL